MDYAFSGSTVRLNQNDYERWKNRFKYIPDFDATLETIDAYYTENPNAQGKWFFQAANWLRKANEEALNKSKQPQYGVDFW